MFIYFNFNVNTINTITFTFKPTVVQIPFIQTGHKYLNCNNITFTILKMLSILLHPLCYFNYYAISYTM